MSTAKPHILNAEEEQYVAQLNERDRRLHVIATQKLETSYFVKRTHGFKAWKAKQQAAQDQSVLKK
jgi:hypothetical protein